MATIRERVAAALEATFHQEAATNTTPHMWSASEVAAALDCSRSAVRRALSDLAGNGQLEQSLRHVSRNYETIYRWRAAFTVQVGKK